MKPLPEIHTAQLKLRRMEMNDIPSLMKYANNEKIAANIFNIDYPYTKAAAISRYNTVLEGLENANRYIFAITLKTANELIEHYLIKGVYKSVVQYRLLQSEYKPIQKTSD